MKLDGKVLQDFSTNEILDVRSQDTFHHQARVFVGLGEQLDNL